MTNTIETDETESELIGQKETLEEWDPMQLALVIAFALGILIGVNI